MIYKSKLVRYNEVDKKSVFELTKAQKDSLEGLYFWAKIAKKVQQQPGGEAEVSGQYARWAKDLDKLKVPFTIQNLVAQAAQDRKNADRYFVDVLKDIMNSYNKKSMNELKSTPKMLPSESSPKVKKLASFIADKGYRIETHLKINNAEIGDTLLDDINKKIIFTLAKLQKTSDGTLVTGTIIYDETGKYPVGSTQSWIMSIDNSDEYIFLLKKGLRESSSNPAIISLEKLSRTELKQYLKVLKDKTMWNPQLKKAVKSGEIVIQDEIDKVTKMLNL
jgi:hypothetical protein